MAATNRNLTQEIVQGRFRQDLYYRLSVFPIDVPPLRERFEDIPELTAYFVGRSAERVHIRAPSIARQQLETLRRYPWPGNIRELQNVVERAVILSRGGGPVQFDLALPAGRPSAAPRAERMETVEGYVTAREFRERERQNVLAALIGAGWRIYGRDGAAARLGIKPTTLASRMKTLGIARPGSRLDGLSKQRVTGLVRHERRAPAPSATGKTTAADSAAVQGPTHNETGSRVAEER